MSYIPVRPEAKYYVQCSNGKTRGQGTFSKPSNITKKRLQISKRIN